MKVLLLIFLSASLCAAQSNAVNGKGGGITNPSAFMAALGAAPLSGATFTGLVKIPGTSVVSGGTTQMLLGQTDLVLDSDKGLLTAYSTTRHAGTFWSSSANGILAVSVSGQAAKFYQPGTTYTTDAPVVRISRGDSGGNAISPMLKIVDYKTVSAGGSPIQVLKGGDVAPANTLFEVQADGSLILRCVANGTRWKLVVSNTGALSTVAVP